MSVAVSVINLRASLVIIHESFVIFIFYFFRDWGGRLVVIETKRVKRHKTEITKRVKVEMKN